MGNSPIARRMTDPGKRLHKHKVVIEYYNAPSQDEIDVIKKLYKRDNNTVDIKTKLGYIPIKE